MEILERVCVREKWVGGGKEMVRKNALLMGEPHAWRECQREVGGRRKGNCQKECPLDGEPHADQRENMMLASLTCFAFVYVVY